MYESTSIKLYFRTFGTLYVGLQRCSRGAVAALCMYEGTLRVLKYFRKYFRTKVRKYSILRRCQSSCIILL